MWRSVRMTSNYQSAVLRLQTLQKTLGQNGKVTWLSTASDGSVVRIGDVVKEIKLPKNPELVPVNYLPETKPQTLLKHLRWILQKDLLGQDVFLIGPPGPLKRSIAMMYLELTKREVEYVSLSRDTTEMDLKQRREIKSGNAFHIDQCAVKAAKEGRILVLEGIEKAERNVLPVLNNLLENREMQLDDGRFLMAAERYDKLLKEHSQETLDKWKLVRVDEDFRVIALGLPVPRYQGNPLDPPLRSRFQARDVNPLPFKDQMEIISEAGENLTPDKLTQLLSFTMTLKSEEASSLGLPDFPLDNLKNIVKIMNTVPEISVARMIQKLYPYEVMLSKDGQMSVNSALQSFELHHPVTTGRAEISEIRRQHDKATVEVQCNRKTYNLPLKGGIIENAIPEEFVNTAYHDELLADMMMTHMVQDFCVIGPRGCGKSMLAKRFADLLGYHIEPIMLYQDMTSRDLLQQRTTTPNGDTSWRPSPLVTAAKEGHLAVLDGIHRVNNGTFAVLNRLIHDRELTLFDGTKLLRLDRYEKIKTEEDLTDKEMEARSIFPIHPSFRVIGLSEPPNLASSSTQWMNSEVLTMFLYHHMRPLSKKEEDEVLHKLVPNMAEMGPILKLTHKLRTSGDTNLKSVSSSLSTRQLLRIAKRMSKYPDDNMYDVLHKSCLARFLPRIAKSTFDEELQNFDINKPASTLNDANFEKALTCEIKDGLLRIGNTECVVSDTTSQMKVPDVLFYENPQHIAVMEDMLKDYLLGDHLLLIGNQGVGKNKIIDRFLQLLNRPREYLQLHRDTTVQTLTLQPTVQDGVIKYEDSPLVKAVKNGHILVVDEADKAPTAVTCILKTLVESGEMHLADGRRIVTHKSGIPASENVIVCHPEFRMFVLANRPGFPFLGNDFFGAMGDIFSCHAIDNPDPKSEMSMLTQYGPNVPVDILNKLVSSFGELRDMADQGLIQYPYSTREVVNVVKHLEKFPEEGLGKVVRNVFDFDSYDKELSKTVIETLHKHGIPIGANPTHVNVAKEFPLPKFEYVGQLEMKTQGQRKRTGLLSCPVEDKVLKIKGPVRVNMQHYPMDKTEARSILFTEQEAFWDIPIHETSVIVDVAVTKAANRSPTAGKMKDDLIHIATANPISLYTMSPRHRNLTCIDLYDIFPETRPTTYRPRIHLAPLGAPLDNRVVLHEEVTNIVLSIDTETGDVSRLETATLLETAANTITKNFRQQQGYHKMNWDFAFSPDGMLLFYKEDGQSIDVVRMLEGTCHSISIPIKLESIHMISKEDWLLSEMGTNSKYMLSSTVENPFEYIFKPIAEKADTSEPLIGNVILTAKHKLEDALLSKALGEKITSPNRVMLNKDTYATLAVGLPELSTVDVHKIPRQEIEDLSPANVRQKALAKKAAAVRPPFAYMHDTGLAVRAIPVHNTPKEVFHEGVKPKGITTYLEVADIVHKKLRYIPVPGATNNSMYNQWYYSTHDVPMVMAEMSNGGLVSVDSGGTVRIWETVVSQLEKSFHEWRQMIGEEDRPLQITNEREPQNFDFDPKIGKIDSTGAPHVGGNTWAGGTGGYNTAGLGGVGGPFRLDAGHDVTQVPDHVKDDVPEEVKRAAREMGMRAWKEKLKQIQMSEYDAEMYDGFSGGVKRQIQSLRVILDSLQAKGKERQWLKNQAYGDLDDAKLIEGLTGEKSIYKRRGEREPELGSPQEKAKLLRIVCDVSGSMYRFNGYDGRLQRELEAMVMVMEALDGYEHKIKYDIIGHSGEGYDFEFVKSSKLPKNNKERLDVVRTLHAHSQFCSSGDHTLEATQHAVKSIVKEEADEHFVIILSDANLDRYGIRPKHFVDILTADEDVNAYVIFIGSLGNQATSLMKQMPSGRAFVCMDTKNLPQILQQIFTSTMLSTK